MVEADPIYLNFPPDHDLHLGYNQSGTTNPSLAEADAMLVDRGGRSLVSAP